MARPIDAVKTAEIISEHLGISLADLCDVFAAIPTEDVMPIVHGKWDICSNGYYPYCSICRCEPEGKKLTKYCPNCGAKMDGENNE